MYIFLLLIILFLTSCSPADVVTEEFQHDDQEDTVIGESNYQSEFQADKTTSSYAIKDGKLIWLRNSSHSNQQFLESIDNVVEVYGDRFAFFGNGDVVDMYGRTPEEIIKAVVDPETPNYDSLEEVTLSTIKDLYQNIGIKKFYDPPVAYYVIRANDGNVYYLDTSVNLEGMVTVQKDILTENGKIYDERFPETASWENVTDYHSCENFIIALTSDGKVLSSGIDFSVENAIKIKIIYYEAQRIPAVLTSDGKLVFGEIQEDHSNIYGTTADQLEKYYQELRDSLAQAESITDVIDFTYTDGSKLVILAQKADGTLWATANDIYNPEYVNQIE